MNSTNEHNADLQEDDYVLPEIPRDAAGIPTFVFKDDLEGDDRPTAERKVLEIALLWRESVMRIAHYNMDTPDVITVGEGRKNDFRIAAEGLPADRFCIAQPAGDGETIINWADGMSMEVRGAEGDILNTQELHAEGRVQYDDSLPRPVYGYSLGLNDRVALQIGELTFVIQYVSPIRLTPVGPLSGFDYCFSKILALSAIGHVLLFLALLLLPQEPQDIEEDLFENPNRFAQLILREPKKPIKKRQRLSGSKGGGRHKGKEGKFGKRSPEKPDALASKKGAPMVDRLKRERDRNVALNSGILKVLGAGKGAVSNVLGPGGLGTGMNKALGGLRGTAMGDAGGSGGLGTRGTGSGGGGKSLGIGGLGNGRGRGTGGLGKVDLGGRGKSAYKVEVGRTITKGCLTASQVARVIGRVQSQAKYCYEKEINRNPDLAGKVTTRMEVNAAGGVSWVRVMNSTLGDSNVEKCLIRVMQRMRFPKCQGGGTAEITYPWIFKSSGG